MKMETKRTLYLTKAEKKVLTDFYWNFYEDDVADDMFEVLRALSEDTPGYTSCEIEITD
jgi:hypothetical protein